MEESDPQAATFRYKFVVTQATSARDLYLVVPAYLRLVELLGKLERHEEALEVIQGFEQRYEGKKPLPPFPTEAQKGAMSIQKSRLAVMVRRVATVAATT